MYLQYDVIAVVNKICWKVLGETDVIFSYFYVCKAEYKREHL